MKVIKCRVKMLPAISLVFTFMFYINNFSFADGEKIMPDTSNATRIWTINLYKQGTAGIPELENALDDKSILTRRAAARTLAELGIPAANALIKAAENEDALVRRTAFLFLLKNDKALKYLEKALSDPDITIREDAAKYLIGIKPRTEKVTALMEKATKDEAAEVRLPVTAAIWPFHKEVVLLKDRPDMADHTARIKLLQSIELPLKGWKFKVDTKLDGHVKQWFKADMDDAKWREISIGHWSENCIGVAWQRISFDLPPKPDLTASEIRFGAIDESAWVWLNGKYLGQHDIGVEGWNKEFSLDATNELNWGKKNQLTVRVLNTEQGGGIWKPVYIDVLKFK